MIVDINYWDDGDDEERRVYLSNGIRNVRRFISMAGGQAQALSFVLFPLFWQYLEGEVIKWFWMLMLFPIFFFF